MLLGLALPIGHPIVGALAEAHARGIVHRNVEPENTSVAPAGDEPDFAKALDFGLAKVLDEARRANASANGRHFGHGRIYFAGSGSLRGFWRALREIGHVGDAVSNTIDC